MALNQDGFSIQDANRRFVDELLGSLGATRKGRRIEKIAERLAVLLRASAVSLVIRKCGCLYVRRYVPNAGSLERATAEEMHIWEEASHGRLFALCADEMHGAKTVSELRVRVHDLEPAAKAEERLRALLIISGIRMELRPSVRGVRAVAGLAQKLSHYMSEEFSAETVRQTLDAHRRMAALQNRSSATADLCYQAAREIRHLLHYDGYCYVFVWQKLRRYLEAVAILPSREASSEFYPNRDAYPRLVLLGDDLTFSDFPPVEATVVDVATGAVRCHGVWNATVSDAVAKRMSVLARLLVRARFAHTGTILVCPLIWRREVVGVFVITSREADAFDSEEVQTALDLTRYPTPAIARDARIWEEFSLLSREEKGAEQDTESEQAPYHPFLSLFCERLRIHRGAHLALIIPLVHHADEVVEHAWMASSRWPERLLKWESLFDEITDQVLASGEWLWLAAESPGRDEVPDSFLKRHQIVRALAIGLYSGSSPGTSRLAGVLLVGFEASVYENPHIHEFGHLERAYINIFRFAIQDYLTKYQRYKYQRRFYRILASIYTTLATLRYDHEELEQLLRSIFDAGMRLVGATAGLLAVPSPDCEGLKVLYQQRLVDANEGSPMTARRFMHSHVDHSTWHKLVAPGQGVTGRCFDMEASIVVPSLADRSTWPKDVEPLPWVPDSRSEIAVPLKSSHGVIGVLDFESQIMEYAFGDQEQAALEKLAEASVITVELMQTFRQLSSLRQVSESIKKQPTPHKIYELLLEEGQKITEAYAACVHVIDPTQTMLDPVVSRGPDTEHYEIKVPKEEGTLGWAFSNEKTCYIPDVRDRIALTETHPGLVYRASRPQTRSEIAVPIHWRGDRIGVMNFQHVQPRALEPYRRYLESLATQASFSLFQIREIELKLRAKEFDLTTGLSHFATEVSHDLRKDFDSIRAEAAGTLEAIEKGADGDLVRLAEKLRAIATQAQAGSNRTIALLGWIPGPMREPKVANPLELVGGVIRDLRGALEQPVKFRIVATSREVRNARVATRGNLLDWCLREILHNSCEHGATRVVVRFSLEAGSLRIQISDNGIGVPEGVDLEEMYRFEKTTLRVTGQGRALPLCRAYLAEIDATVEPHRNRRRGLSTIVDMRIAEEVSS